MAASCGIYTDLTFWNTETGYTQPAKGVNPWEDGNTIVSTSAEFVSMWSGIATTLKSYPSVIFELFNEPSGAESEWFSVAQQCITSMRATGATQPILMQYWYGITYDFGSGSYLGMNWVT